MANEEKKNIVLFFLLIFYQGFLIIKCLRSKLAMETMFEKFRKRANWEP